MKKYITKQSDIKGAGKGLFTKAAFKKGEVIGLAHVDGQPTIEIGKNHNHNEKTPTANNVKNGNKRYLVASRNLQPGEEITTNYRLQPELEQPEDFEKKKGGNMTPQKDGYRTYSPFKKLPYIDVESDTIDSNNIVYDLNLQADNGLTKFIGKNTGLHTLPGAKVIREIPVKRKGGLSSLPTDKPEKSKKFSRSLDATNRLFTENYLFEKPKSRKNKIFDPHAKYYAEGGEYEEAELTPEEIEAYRAEGYTVDDNEYQDGGQSGKPCPEEGYAFNPKTGECIEWNPAIWKSNDEPTSYDPVGDIIYMNPNDRSLDMNDDQYKKLYNDQLQHEQLHRLQWLNGELKGESGTPLRMPSTVDNQNYDGDHYYNRRGEEESYLHHMFNQDNPELAKFIPSEIIYDKVINPSMYDIPWTEEGEARDYEYNVSGGMPSLFPKKKEGGASSCPKGEYWNGTKCVKIPKNTRIVYHTDKDVYDKAFAAESDSSHFYNNAKSDFNKFDKLGDRFSTPMSNEEWQKVSDQYYKLLNSQKNKWHTDEYRRDVYTPNYTVNYKYKGPKSGLTIKPVGLEGFYREGYNFPRFKKPVVHNVYEEPIEEEFIPMPIKEPELISTSTGDIIGQSEQLLAPEYSANYPKNRIGYNKYNWNTTKSGLNKRQPNTGGFYKKASKKVEDLQNYMEGYEDEDGNYIPGEIEKAKQEGRQIKFKGNVSKGDKEAQEKYIQEYGDYENLKNYQNQIMNLMQYKLNKKQYGGDQSFVKKGGALLTKKVTCKKCGWKWDAADGGDDITTCHKCGGQGLVHAQKGGGLNKFVDGGPTDCGEGYIWNEELQECVEDTSKYNEKSYAKHLAEKKIYEDALKEIEVGTTEYAILEEAYNAKVKKLEKEKARVLKVRGNVIPASKALDEADDLIKRSDPFYQDYIYAENPKELALARKALPQEIKNVLPNQALYNIAKWDTKTNKWNEGLHPSRELYCTPYGCFAYQKAGASDVPTIGGNIDFANRAATGDFAFEKINPNERQPGDMALMVEMAPNDYSDGNSGMSRRPHHTTIYAEPDPRSPKDTKAGNFYNAYDGLRLNFKKSFLATKRKPGDRFDYYRYVGAQNKINNEVLDLAKQKEEFNTKQEQRKNNAALPSIPTLKPNLITQNNTATLQYPKKEEKLKNKRKLFKNKSFELGGLNKFAGGGYIETELTPEEIEEYRRGGFTIEEIY